MTSTPFRTLQSKKRGRTQAPSNVVAPHQGSIGTTGFLPTQIARPDKPRAREGEAENLVAFFDETRRKSVSSFVLKRAKLQARRFPHGASAALQRLVDAALEEKLAERLNPPSDALVAARERGAAWKRAEYGNPDNLPLKDAAAHVELSPRVINKRRNAGCYYALLSEGQTRGFRFPRWQFDAPAQRLQSILDVAQKGKASAWGVHVFMISPSSLLDGVAPREWIGDATKDLERVIVLARNRFYGDQGAG